VKRGCNEFCRYSEGPGGRKLAAPAKVLRLLLPFSGRRGGLGGQLAIEEAPGLKQHPASEVLLSVRVHSDVAVHRVLPCGLGRAAAKLLVLPGSRSTRLLLHDASGCVTALC